MSAPRERITILLAKEDGSDLVRLFVGCPPTYSDKELDQLEKSSGGLSDAVLKFIGRDAKAQVEKERNAFQSQLLTAVVEGGKLKGSSSTSNKDEDGLGALRALSLTKGAFDLSDGIPRFVIFSPMKLPALRNLADTKSARQKGFDSAAKIGADLQRAEIYLTGLASDTPKFAGDVPIIVEKG